MNETITLVLTREQAEDIRTILGRAARNYKNDAILATLRNAEYYQKMLEKTDEFSDTICRAQIAAGMYG